MSDLDSQLEFVTDPSAEPADLDQALARFLLAFVRTTDAPTSAGDLPPSAEVSLDSADSNVF